MNCIARQPDHSRWLIPGFRDLLCQARKAFALIAVYLEIGGVEPAFETGIAAGPAASKALRLAVAEELPGAP